MHVRTHAYLYICIYTYRKERVAACKMKIGALVTASYLWYGYWRGVEMEKAVCV